MGKCEFGIAKYCDQCAGGYCRKHEVQISELRKCGILKRQHPKYVDQSIQVVLE